MIFEINSIDDISVHEDWKAECGIETPPLIDMGKGYTDAPLFGDGDVGDGLGSGGSEDAAAGELPREFVDIGERADHFMGSRTARILGFHYVTGWP